MSNPSGEHWQAIVGELALQFDRVWGRPIPQPGPRERVATLFAVRAMRRTVALTRLLEHGLYLESHAVVRMAYEDWIQLAYAMRTPGDERVREFADQVSKNDARIHDAFKALCGEEAAKKFFGTPPVAAEAHIGAPRQLTAPPLMATMAADVGLRRVHDFVFTYLSARAHPEFRFNAVFELTRPLARPRGLRRDPEEEVLLNVWFLWFTARILDLGAREFGHDLSDFHGKWLRPLLERGCDTLVTCAMVKEGGQA